MSASSRGRSGRAALPPSAEPLRLVTTDGVALAGVHLPAADRALAVVVGHGFTHSTGKPGTRRILRRLHRGGVGVLAVDFRGHGRSGGRSSVGRDEYLDLDAAVAAARQAGYRRVVTLGFSMGGSVALVHGARGSHLPDAVVSVSAPSRWFIRESVAMRRVHWLLEHPLGPGVGRVMGVRLSDPWPDVPDTPLELVAGIAPLPLLLVHGTADHYFGPAHGVALHRAAGHGELWLEPGMGHAESGASPDLIDRLLGWIRLVPVKAG
ncbi:alpha/beta fold hydrolase [Nakamurella sp. YIM 132087]|uniref:Alpha/beta fold hydrolase n=1 Tax=Nakamurella alba TaxID=2665158 RepID=A0A7K1FPP8_9ACTN|nr:alpha/beta fold hydrolase [Nakamurella alba]MTD16107.1 alpha/beta fold hydrolase [Nakamurella alba]